MQFSGLGLDERIVRALAEAGIETCTAVQDQTLVHSLEGRDVAVQSQTGTGKTIAFLVTAFQRSLRPDGVGARTLIVAPTRELAVQIQKEAELVGKYLPHRTGCFFGGVGYGDQERLLRDGVDMVIGTPGRLLDYASSRKLDFRTFRIVIIDEADRLFDMGFIPDLRRILRSALSPAERQTMLFSATLGERVKQLAWEHMNEPISVEIEPDVVTVREVTQVLYHVGKEDKVRLLLGLIRRDNPQRTLIFTNTKHAAEVVARRLEVNGIRSRFIMGDLPQSKRLALMGEMKAGRIPLLVATDVAARGLHIDDVDLVVNYDLPEDRESYVHRIGRTARAGKSGKAVSLVCERYVYSLEAIESFINMKIPVGQVTNDLLAEDASAGMGFARPLRAARGGGPRRGGRGERRPAARGREGERPVRRSVPASPRPAAGAADRAGSERGGRKPATPRVRVSRDSPVEERMAYYRSKYDQGGGGAMQRPGQGPTAPAGEGGGQSRRKRSRKRPSGAPRQSSTPREGTGQRGTPRPRAEKTPPAPAPPPPARASLLDRLRGIFKKRGREGDPRAGA